MINLKNLIYYKTNAPLKRNNLVKNTIVRENHVNTVYYKELFVVQ